MKTLRKIVIAVLITAVALVLFIVVVRWQLWAPARNMERSVRSMIGRPETEILKVFGSPQYIVSADTLAGRTVDYPWKDMHYVPVPDRPVRNRVLLYSKLNVAFYVYVDENGIVEYVAVGET
jgi:hypothetical protein